MMTYQQPPDVEFVNNYRLGGFHPVHIGDTFKGDRYTIVQKLGYGTFSTVWLVKDSTNEAYVSLKILAASSSKWSKNSQSEDEEIKILRHLGDGEDTGKHYVTQLLDDFLHHGPNGVHRCIVTELLGPRLSSDIEELYPTEVFPAPIAKSFIKQIAYGVRYLHRKGIVHGDLHTGNILFFAPELTSLSEKQVLECFGEPGIFPLRLAKDTDPEAVPPSQSPPHVPRYLVTTPDPTPLLHICFNDPPRTGVKICDFSESFMIETNKGARLSNMPRIYRAPEIMLGGPSTPSASTDVWALAVLFHSILTGGATLFNSYYGIQDELLCSMVLLLGKLPEPTWSAWPDRRLFFDDQGTWVGDSKLLTSPNTHNFLKIRRGIMDDERERKLFEKMLRSMVALQPEERATMEDVINSEWFVKYCLEDNSIVAAAA